MLLPRVGTRKNDIQLTESDEAKGLWSAKNVRLDDGEIKFRFHYNWQYNFGDDNGDGIGELHGKNIPVRAGHYNILLDLRDEAKVVYEIKLCD